MQQSRRYFPRKSEPKKNKTKMKMKSGEVNSQNAYMRFCKVAEVATELAPNILCTEKKKYNQ